MIFCGTHTRVERMILNCRHNLILMQHPYETFTMKVRMSLEEIINLAVQ